MRAFFSFNPLLDTMDGSLIRWPPEDISLGWWHLNILAHRNRELCWLSPIQKILCIVLVHIQTTFVEQGEEDIIFSWDLWTYSNPSEKVMDHSLTPSNSMSTHLLVTFRRGIITQLSLWEEYFNCDWIGCTNELIASRQKAEKLPPPPPRPNLIPAAEDCKSSTLLYTNNYSANESDWKRVMRLSWSYTT